MSSPQISEGPVLLTLGRSGGCGVLVVEAHNAVLVKNRVSDRKPSS